jgi:riboflavin kinase / FMN adenylyltransferase
MLTLRTPVNEARILIRGEVEHGDERGRLLGFPTANIAISVDGLAPPDAVYAGYVYRADGRWQQRAAVSIGRRPTFYADRGLHLLEAHLLDFTGNLYGEILTVELVAKLRDQVRFDGPEALAEQLARDVARCADVLTRFSPGGRLAA